MKQVLNKKMSDIAKIRPVKVLEIELSQPLAEIDARDGHQEEIYSKALILVRLHSFPLGLLELDFTSGVITADDLALECWSQLNRQISQHLCEDGLDQAWQLTEAGLPHDVIPKCLVKRRASMLEAPPVSVIIATRERVQSLARTLDSILEQEFPQFELILVDNAPQTSATYDYIVENKARFSRRKIDLRYIREDIPGLAVAHNRGLEAARGSIVAFTDDDVLVDRHWLVELVAGFSAAPNVGCVTGLVVPFELETPAQVLFEEFGGFTKGFTPRTYDLISSRPPDLLFPYTAGRFGTGANMAFRSEYLVKVGGFEPALGIGTPALGGDDMSAFYEILQGGYQLVYQPSAIIHHQHRRSMTELERQMRGYGVGLTAFLFKCLVEDLKSIREIAPKIPAAIRYALSSDSTKNRHKTKDYPHSLEWIERGGMLYGPLAYLRSCWNYRALRIARRRLHRNRETALSQQYLVNGWVEDVSREK